MKHFYRIISSLILLLSTNVAIAQYCTPLYDTANCSTGSQDYINSFSTSGGVTNISNLASGCTTTGTSLNYKYYSGTGYTVTEQQGGSFNLSLTITTAFAQGVIVWADWNHDFLFDSLTERIYSGTNTLIAGGTATATVTVPNNAYVGTTRIRARVVYGVINFGACSKYTYGEVEDYQMNITSASSLAPVANFSVSSLTVNTGGTLSFTDLSTNAPTAWSWSFPGGTPSTSNLQNPVVVYNTPGTYSVTLTVANAAGSNFITATNYITVTNSSYCLPSNPPCSGTDYISNVTISNTTLNNSSTCSGTTTSYSSYPATGSTTATLYTNTSYSLSVTSTSISIISAWIDFDQSGTFDASEWTQVTTLTSIGVPAQVSFLVPSTALTGITTMRIRSRANGNPNGSANACSSFGTGETEDYQINIASNISAPPVANFSVSSVTVNTGGTLSFTDLSTNSPTAWFWSFPGGTPSFSSLQNPTVVYNTPGTYSVTLTSTNAAGSNNITATNFITVTSSSYCIPTNPACNTIDYISNVSFLNTTLNNFSTCTGTSSSYSSFPASGSTTATLNTNSAYILSVTSISTSIISVWIDYDQSGTFDATEWTQVTTLNTANIASQVPILIPSTALTGVTTMRIRSRANANANGATDACTTFGSGETEDYQITIANPAAAPAANFSANFTTISVGGSTNFTDLSSNVPTSWSWSFPGGTPSTSVAQNPTNIVYNTPGCYTVTLTATNALGSNSVSSTCYINVLPAGQQYCLPNPTNGTASGDFINGVQINTLSNLATGSNTGPSYSYYNSFSTDLYGGSTYALSVQNGTWATDTIAVWIDYNGDGDFADAGEKIDQISTTTANTYYTMNITIPTGASGGYKIMRVRLIDNSAALTNADPCTDYLYGETEDYIVNIIQSAPPVASFTSDVLNVTTGGTVNYYDISTNSPTSWFWSFPGGSPSTSTLQSPLVVYNTPGCYAVTLTASNAFGTNTTTTTCYVQVTNGSIYCTTNLHSVDCSGGYINTVAITGTTLNAANTGCSSGSELGYVQWNPTGAGTASLTKGQTYTFNVTTSVSSIISVWIDYNQNGIFESTEWKQISTASTANVAASNTINIPTSALTGSTRMRVRSRNAGAANASTDACTLFGSGETEDYIIQIQNNSTVAPVAAFTANTTTINVGQSVTFTDLSINSPTSWSWSFAGGTPTSSTTQNPTITYNNPGTYSVSLTATNAVGSNTTTQTSYITVLNAIQYVGMGSSANVYTALVEQSNSLTANQDLNMIMFTRRKNTGDAGNSGYVQSSYSINGGLAFDSSLTIISNATNLSRYPSGAIFNTSGNTVATNAFSVVSGPFTTSAGAWAGNYFGSSKINNTLNNQLFYTNTALPAGQIKSDFARYGIEANSAFVSVCGGRFLDVNGTTNATSGFSGAVLHKGVYSAVTSQFTWTPKYVRHSFSHSTLDNSALAISTPLAAWSNNGTIGYLVFMGVDSVGFNNGSNKRFQPIVYKSTNSGTTWTQMTLTNYSNLTNINSFLTPTTSGTKAAAFLTTHGWDVTVDATNNLHIAAVIGSHSTENVDSLSYYYNAAPKYVYDIYTTSTGWNALLLDTITTDEVDAATSAWQASDGSGGSAWGSRLQISKSSDGNRIFYGWVDTDPSYASATNTNPDINLKGYNVQTNLLTPTRNFTKNTFFGGKAFFHYISNITLKTGTTYTIPGSLVSSRSNTYDATAAVQHWYVKNMQFTDNDFTITPTQGSVATLPNASFTQSAIDICAAGSINFTNTSTNATTYSWTFPGGNPSTSTAQNPTSNWNLPGTYTITLTATNANGSSTATQTITVNALPTANAGADAVICAGSSAQIGSSPIANAQYGWSPTTGLNNANTSNPIANPTTTTVYTVTTFANGCSASDVVVVTVNAKPIVNLGADVNICNGSTTSLNAGNQGSSFAWTPTTGLSSSNTQTVVASPTATTTYVVTVTNSNGCSASDNITVNVSSVSANAGQDVTICAGSNTTLTATGGTTYSWSPSTGLSSTTGATVTASPTQTTTYTVTATSNGCTATDQVIVNVNSVSANAGADAVICAGSSAQIGSSPIANAQYGWSPTTGLNNANTSNPIANPTTTTVYTVTTFANGCSASDVVVVTVNAKPIVNLGADVNICNGSTTSLNAGNQGSSFAWTPTTGLSSSNTQTVVASPTATTTYVVTVTNSNGCSASDNIAVNVNSVSANAGQDVTICAGSNTTLTATGGATYSWSPSTGLSSTTGASVTASPTQTTTYTVTATNNGCTATDQVIVNVNSVSANAGADATICPGSSTQLLATGGTSYSWSPSAGLSSTSISNPIATPTTTTTYTVTVTNGSCTATDAVIVNVNGVVANAGIDQNVCLGSSSQLNATGGSTYSWSPSTGLSNVSIANPIATPSVTTTYTVTVSNNGCSNTDQVTVTVNTSSANAGNDVTICAGNSVQLGATGGVSYSWSPSTGLSNASAANPIASPTQTTTYLVTATSGTCVTTDFVTVTVASNLTVNAGTDQTLCSGQTLQMNAVGGAQYSWSPTTGLSNSNIANPIANPTTTTTYTVTTFSGTCSSTDQVTITVVPGITANAGADITLCNGASSSLNATGGTTYSWSPATGLTNSNIANPVAFPTTTTTYVVTATTAGCSDVDTLVVTVGNATANAGIDVALCAGQNTSLNASGGTSYSWSPTTGLSNPNVSNPIATPSATTTYTVTVTSGICTATDNITITLSSVSVNAGQDVQICNGSSANLNALGSGATTYTWTPTTGISNPSISNPVAAPTTSTLYTITVTDGLCSASDNINVVVNPNPTTPVITDNSGTLTTGSAAGYQWLLNGNIIPGANTQQYMPVQNGSYSVVITNGNGCTATSSVYSVLTVGIEDSKLTTENVVMYPNPTSAEITIKVDFYRSEMAQIEIIDMLGKSVVEVENGTVAPGFIKTVDVSSLNSGVYFLRIKTDNQNIVKKLIKE
jgi:PKD repeat protein